MIGLDAIFQRSIASASSIANTQNPATESLAPSAAATRAAPKPYASALIVTSTGTFTRAATAAAFSRSRERSIETVTCGEVIELMIERDQDGSSQIGRTDART